MEDGEIEEGEIAEEEEEVAPPPATALSPPVYSSSSTGSTASAVDALAPPAPVRYQGFSKFLEKDTEQPPLPVPVAKKVERPQGTVTGTVHRVKQSGTRSSRGQVSAPELADRIPFSSQLRDR